MPILKPRFFREGDECSFPPLQKRAYLFKLPGVVPVLGAEHRKACDPCPGATILPASNGKIARRKTLKRNTGYSIQRQERQ